MFGVSNELVKKYPDIAEKLPHGSGIDRAWYLIEPANGRYLYFTNYYHLMDENGFYAGWQGFKVRMSVEDYTEGLWDRFDIQLAYPLNSEVIKQDPSFFRDFLWDTVYHSLNY